MSKTKPDNKAALQAKIGDAALRKATGKDWGEWLTVLDKANAATMPHQDIANHLYDKEGVPGWWCQMVAAGYEQARGLRQKHQRPDGYEISVSKTVGAPIAAAYRAWRERARRQRWLGEPGLVVRKATPHKSLRITWPDGHTSVEARFYENGPAKTQVTVQHAKLRTPRAASQKKTYWAKALAKFAAALE